MAQLGNQTLGFTFTISGTYDQSDSGGWTVPAGGILVSAIHVYAAANGSPATARLYVWNGSTNSWLVRSGQFSLGTAIGWVSRTDLARNGGSDLYIAGGTVMEFGLWVSGANYQYQGQGSGATYIGDGGDGNFHYRAPAGSGMGYMGAYIDYTPLPAPTISSVSPAVAPPGTAITITGTSFLHATGVSIGGTGVSYTIVSDTQITCNVPSGASGSVGVIVTNPAGTSASYSIIAGTTEADNGASWATGVLFAADDGTTWHTSGVQVWADDGTSWHQIG